MYFKKTAMTRAASISQGKPSNEKKVRVRVFRGHRGAIFRIAIPSDWRFALTSSEDGTVRMWNLAGRTRKSKIVCRGTWFCGLAVNGDGSLAAAGDFNGNINLISLSSRQKIIRWKAHPHIVGNLKFLGDGSTLLSAAQGKYIRCWETKKGRRIAQWKSPFTRCFGVDASSDGTQIIGAAVAEGIIFWPSREETAPTIVNDKVGNHSPISISADGRFAYSGTEDGKVTCWDLSQGRRIAAFEGHSGEVHSVAVTPDGNFCVSGGEDGCVRLWATKTGQCLASLRGHKDQVWGVSIAPDARRIASVCEDHTLRIWDIPDSILTPATSQKRGYLNAKVVLLGDSGVGKSGLAMRLWHNRWQKTDSSHGMEIRRLELPQTDGEEHVEREVWLWDLAGQPDYRLTHQLFMEQTSLALLVFDPQAPNIFSTIGYWQEALRKVARSNNVPGILIAARCDRPGLRLTLNEVREWAATRGLHGPILTASKLKKHSGVAELRLLISKLLPWDTMEFRSTMDNFPALKDAIVGVRKEKIAGRVVVKPEELEAHVRKVMPKLSFTSEDLRAVTGLLAGEGILHALPYGDLVVMQPKWVNCYASSLVKLAGEADNQLGHVPLAIIQPGKLPLGSTPRLSFEDEQKLLPALIALFLERALAWTQDTDKGVMLIFPNYVRLPRLSPPPRPGRTVLYRFAGPLEAIYCTLVVRLHYSGLFAETRLFRQAVDFYTDTKKLAALTMNEDGERGELEIYFGAELDADVQASFQRFVHDHLLKKAVEVERVRNFFCTKCKEPVTDRRAIDAAIAKKRQKIVCAYCDPDNPGIIELNDVLEKQFLNKLGEARADQAERRAADEISTAAKEQEMVGEVMTMVASVNQAFIPRVVRDEGTDGEIEFYEPSGKSTGVTYRVQLKSGDSHLKKLKDGTEIFQMKKHYERYWAGKDTVPVLLIIRTNDCRTRFVNATTAISDAQNARPGKPVKQIIFRGEEFNKKAVIKLRDERLQGGNRTGSGR